MYRVLFLHNTVCVWPQLQVVELGGLRKEGLGGGKDAVQWALKVYSVAAEK